jgi:hypothetical protein
MSSSPASRAGSTRGRIRRRSRPGRSRSLRGGLVIFTRPNMKPCLSGSSNKAPRSAKCRSAGRRGGAIFRAATGLSQAFAERSSSSRRPAGPAPSSPRNSPPKKGGNLRQTALRRFSNKLILLMRAVYNFTLAHPADDAILDFIGQMGFSPCQGRLGKSVWTVPPRGPNSSIPASLIGARSIPGCTWLSEGSERRAMGFAPVPWRRKLFRRDDRGRGRPLAGRRDHRPGFFSSAAPGA